MVEPVYQEEWCITPSVKDLLLNKDLDSFRGTTGEIKLYDLSTTASSMLY